MVRTYDPDRPVPDDVLHHLLDLALRAPSAGHTQGRDLLVLREGALARWWDVTTDPDRPPDRWLRGMRTAPVLVLLLSDPGRYLDRYAQPDKGWTDRDEARWPVPYWDVDTGMAAMVLLLAATDAGLGSCFFGVPAERHDAVREAFGIPADRRLVGVVSLGYAAPDRRSPSLRRGRRPLGEVVHDGVFGRAPAWLTSAARGYPGRMSDDKNAAKSIVNVLRDGQKGYAEAAEKLTDSDRPEWVATMNRFAQQRAAFAQEIVDLGHTYGDDVNEDGSVAAAAHRGWLALKDLVTGDSPKGVLDAAVSGEDHSVGVYEDALKDDLSDGFRAVVQRQHAEVVAARDEVKGLQAAS